MKILVVEDETKAAEYLRQRRTENGYTVEVARNGTDGLHAAVNGDHDLASWTDAGGHRWIRGVVRAAHLQAGSRVGADGTGPCRPRGA